MAYAYSQYIQVEGRIKHDKALAAHTYLIDMAHTTKQDI